MAEELLERIPAEKRWAINAQALTRLVVLRIHTAWPILGTGEGIISPIWGLEKYEEINTKIFAEGGKRLFSMVKERFNISVDDAIGAANVTYLAAKFLCGPEHEIEIVEATPERVVYRVTTCAFMKRYKDHKVDVKFTGCPKGHQAWGEEGLKAINPRLTHKTTKTMPEGAPYCEYIIEFKEEKE